MVFSLENVLQVLHELSKTGLGMNIGRGQPEYWSNLLLQSTGNPAVADDD